MSKLSPQTKSFIALFIVAVVVTYVCVALWANLTSSVSGPESYGNYYAAISKIPAPEQAMASPAPVPQVSTADWKTYSDKTDGISFLYNPSWKVLPPQTKDGFKILQVDPGIKYYNIKIYISPKQFYIMDGLPSKTETIGGQTALNVGNALYGIEANGTYYTFDVGMSMSLVPSFDALVHSVQFQ